MHIKISTPLGQSYDIQIAQQVKMSSRGLRGHDRDSFIKRAGHHFARALTKIALHPGEIPVHFIALGATELYGPNRNGDGFKIATCRSCHPTFVKHAMFFRNHQNKDKAKSYGSVKMSHYNEAMHRIELLVALNATEEAAEKNGNLVADEELNLLSSGKDLPASMACKVAYDICAGCGNKARNRSEYCKGLDEGGLCKRGGVANRMTFVHDDGFVNYVDNPSPLVWFDLSNVKRGADRIAFANGIVKTANEIVLGSAALAEELGLTVPDWLAA